MHSADLKMSPKLSGNTASSPVGSLALNCPRVAIDIQTSVFSLRFFQQIPVPSYRSNKNNITSVVKGIGLQKHHETKWNCQEIFQSKKSSD
jgi:hypothetical protein